MLIEDKELRDLYEAASTEHLENLEAGILHLEKHPDDLSQLKELLRAAHSLKGDSRMLGVEDAETLTHQFETLLQSLETGQPATPELCDRLYQGLDAIRQIANSAVTGEPCSVDLFQVMTVLMGGEEEAPLSEEKAHGTSGEETAQAAFLAELQQVTAQSAAPAAVLTGPESAEPVEPAVKAGLEIATPSDAVSGNGASGNGASSDSAPSDRTLGESSPGSMDELAAFAAEVALASHAEQEQLESLQEELLQAKQFQDEVARLAETSELTEAGFAGDRSEEMSSDMSDMAAAFAEAVTEAQAASEPEATLASPPVPDVTAEVEPVSYLIEDDELRHLYEVASVEHLDNLEAGCLHLEKHPDDRSQMKELLRAAHSLKGDSRMLGVKDAETLTHQLETLLQGVEQGQQTVDAELCDRLYKGLDAIRQIARSAVTGELCQVNLFAVMAQLMGAESATPPDAAQGIAATAAPPQAQPQPRTQQPQAQQPQVQQSQAQQSQAQQSQIQPPVPATHSQTGAPQAGQSAPSQPKAESPVKPATTKPGRAKLQKEETIRVASAKLDTLITQVSELSVAKRRIVDWSGNVTEMLDFWEGWSREAFVHQLGFSRIQEQLAPDVAQPLTAFYKQNQNRIEQLGQYVQQFRGQTSEEGARLDSIAGDLEASIRNLRMLPLSNVFGLFRRMVRDLANQQGKDVDFIIEGGDTQVDKRIIEEIKDPLSHLLRNAIDHGIETTTDRLAAGKSPTATLRLQGYRRGGSVIIEITDDGKGLDINKIQQTALRRGVCNEASLAKMTQQQIQFLIFAPGFSTRTQVSEISGRGVGLDVVRTNIERLKGSIGVDSKLGKGCQFRLTLNPSLATTEALILKVEETSYAMPIEYVDRMVTVEREQLFAIKGNLTTTIDDEPISVAWLSDLLQIPTSIPMSGKEAEQIAQKIPCIILKVGSKKLGLFVDQLIDQQEIILKAQSKLLQRVRNLTGSTILGNGEVCLVLNPQDLFRTALKQNGALETFEQINSAVNQQSRILLVEDSIPIRTQVKRILEGAGYEVVATVDGLDGYNTLREQEQSFAAIVSDVEMPNMTGLELAAKVREHREYDALPFVLVTTLATDADRQRGRDAGANAYLTKGNFDQSLLLDTLRGLIQA